MVYSSCGSLLLRVFCRARRLYGLTLIGSLQGMAYSVAAGDLERLSLAREILGARMGSSLLARDQAAREAFEISGKWLRGPDAIGLTADHVRQVIERAIATLND
jgi:hypothetical protein